MEPTHGQEGNSPCLVHVVSVSQPVQSWTVIRDHVDFVALGNALSTIIRGLPTCPTPPPQSNGPEDNTRIVTARNALQEWLTSVLFVPGARENPAVRQFLCYGANIVPPQFEGVAWVQFADDNFAHSSARNASIESQTGIAASLASSAPVALDEMEMDDMFGYEADGLEADEGGPDFDSDSEADYFSATIRYQPADEAITEDDIMEMQQQANEVEMVEDVGSLAQSLGASHLGRSLQLQAQLAGSSKQGHADIFSEKSQKGLTVGGGAGAAEANRGSTGGIGGAVEQAQSGGAMPMMNQPAKFDGLGDSFDQRAPISQPRLDSFKMIKVIGKGSFGKPFLSCFPVQITVTFAHPDFLTIFSLYFYCIFDLHAWCGWIHR